MSYSQYRAEQIRLAHASARPKRDTPAWVNCHHDCGVLLYEIRQLQRHIWRSGAGESYNEISRLQSEIERLQSEAEWHAGNTALNQRLLVENDQLQREIAERKAAQEWSDVEIKKLSALNAELLAALKALVDELAEDVGQRHYRVYQISPRAVEEARAAIAKAETK